MSIHHHSPVKRLAGETAYAERDAKRYTQLVHSMRSVLERTHDGQLVLAVEQYVLATAIDRVDELEGQTSAAYDRNIGQVSEPVAVSFQMTLVYTRRARTDRTAIFRGDNLKTRQFTA